MYSAPSGRIRAMNTGVDVEMTTRVKIAAHCQSHCQELETETGEGTSGGVGKKHIEGTPMTAVSG